MRSFLYLLVVVFLFSSVTTCVRCLHHSKATHFSSASALSSGACAYGSVASSFFAGHIAAATPSIYKYGVGCGACFQVRCTNPKLCTSKGTIVMVTDLNKNSQTDLILSSKAFRAMAKPVAGADIYLLKQGIVEVEYQRVSCNYGKGETAISAHAAKGGTLKVRVEEASKKPTHLVIKLLGPPKELIDVQISEVDSSNWNEMTKSQEDVWATDTAPPGALLLVFTVQPRGSTGSGDDKVVWSTRAIPANWEVGKIYDTGAQITGVAQEDCDTCNQIRN